MAVAIAGNGMKRVVSLAGHSCVAEGYADSSPHILGVFCRFFRLP